MAGRVFRYDVRMGYQKLESAIASFEALATTIGFTYPRRAPVADQIELVKEFLADLQQAQQQAVAKWLAKDLLTWYRAVIAVDMLCDAALTFKDRDPAWLRKQLELATMTDLSQDFEQSQSKEYLYEMQVGAWLHQAGFQVDFAEPDLRVSGNGLSRVLGIACKYVSSEDKLNKNISKGYDQIAGQRLSGFVAIGMDNIICAEIEKFIQLPDDPAEIRRVMGDSLQQWVEKTERSRAGTAGRKPLDGAVFSLRMMGIWGKPAGLVTATHWAFQLQEGNPIEPDLRRIGGELIRAHVSDVG